MTSSYKSLIKRATQSQASIQELSLALVASAVKLDKESYGRINDRFVSHFRKDELENADDFTLWMVGRQYYSALVSNHFTELDLVKKAMDISEERKGKRSNYLIWASGYFAYQKEYYSRMAHILSETDRILSGNDLIWAEVLFLAASAHRRDIYVYQNCLKRLEKIGNGSSTNALENLPYSDYKGWATSLVSIAMSSCEKNDSLKQNMIKIAQESDNEADKALTEAYLSRYYNIEM